MMSSGQPQLGSGSNVNLLRGCGAEVAQDFQAFSVGGREGFEFDFSTTTATGAAQFHLTEDSEKAGQVQEKCERVETL